jgi:hypothetical protein
VRRAAEPGIRLRSAEFRGEREATWRELEALVARVERRGLRSLSAIELARLPVLYRATLSGLSVARGISLDRNLLEYLESLAARAYLCVYGSSRRLRDAVVELVAWRFPAAVRRAARHIAVAALAVAAGGVVGFLITLGDADRYYTFVSPGYAAGRDPAASTDELTAALYEGRASPTRSRHSPRRCSRTTRRPGSCRSRSGWRSACRR